MTPDDQRASKKFVCASELARMFKSMICLFLTTSFLILNVKPGSMDSPSASSPVQGEDIHYLEDPAEMAADQTGVFKDSAYAFDDSMATEEHSQFQSSPEHSVKLNMMAIICLVVTVLNMFFEAQTVINMCLEFIEDDEENWNSSSRTFYYYQ
mmetsp:Transcript_6467/g.7553  ORF Transcript_6467/g.7553 Transcript_6467/m.7553 type:complete len:153 (+) Transcript_6467:88-546(+)